MKNEINAITAAQVDELGALLKQIKDLTDKAEKIKDNIKDFGNKSGDRKFAGDAFEALYIESNVSTVNWKKIAADLKIPAEVIAANTSTAARFSVKVEAK
jgi:phosphoketolase